MKQKDKKERRINIICYGIAFIIAMWLCWPLFVDLVNQFVEPQWMKTINQSIHSQEELKGMSDKLENVNNAIREDTENSGLQNAEDAMSKIKDILNKVPKTE